MALVFNDPVVTDYNGNEVTHLGKPIRSSTINTYPKNFRDFHGFTDPYFEKLSTAQKNKLLYDFIAAMEQNLTTVNIQNNNTLTEISNHFGSDLKEKGDYVDKSKITFNTAEYETVTSDRLLRNTIIVVRGVREVVVQDGVKGSYCFAEIIAQGILVREAVDITSIVLQNNEYVQPRVEKNVSNEVCDVQYDLYKWVYCTEKARKFKIEKKPNEDSPSMYF